MRVKLLASDVLEDLEAEVNEFCSHERVIDVSLSGNMNAWVATIKYQPVARPATADLGEALKKAVGVLNSQ